MKARRRRPNPCRDLERLERRELLSQGATPVLGGDPFANSTTDNPAAQTGTLYPDSQVEPDIVVNPTRPNNVVAPLATGPLEQRRGPRHRRGRQQQRRQPLDPGGPARRLQGVGRRVRPRLQRLDVVRARRHPLRLDDRLQPRPELPRPVQHQRLGGLRQQVHRRRIHLERPDDDHQRPEPGRGPQRRPGAGLQRQGHGDRRPDPARLRVGCPV